MTKSLSIPHFGYDDEYDMSQLVELRSRLKKEVKHKADVKLSYMPFIVKATSLALSHFPILNAQIDAAEENLIYKASGFCATLASQNYDLAYSYFWLIFGFHIFLETSSNRLTTTSVLQWTHSTASSCHV